MRAARVLVMMVRPPLAVLLLLFAAIGAAQAGGGGALHPLFTTVLVIVGGWFVSATVLNDVADEAIDRVNLAHARGRPLVSGDATRRELLVLGAAAGVVSLVVGWAVSWPVGLVVVAGLALSVAYSTRPVRLSDRGALASLLLPLGYVALPFLVGALSVRPQLGRDNLLLLAGLYVTFMGRILLKDFRDVRGDELYGKRTFLLRHGRRATCAVSAGCWVAGSASLLALIPFRSLLTGVFVVYLGCALDGLRRLAVASDPTEEQHLIGAIAQAGRGMAITLLAHFTMASKGWPPGRQAVVLLLVTAVFVGMYAAAVAERERVPAPQPF